MRPGETGEKHNVVLQARRDDVDKLALFYLSPSPPFFIVIASSVRHAAPHPREKLKNLLALVVHGEKIIHCRCGSSWVDTERTAQRPPEPAPPRETWLEPCLAWLVDALPALAAIETRMQSG